MIMRVLAFAAIFLCLYFLLEPGAVSDLRSELVDKLDALRDVLAGIHQRVVHWLGNLRR